MRKLTTVFLAILTCITLVSCGLGTSGGFTQSGRLAGDVSDIDLSGMDVSVGSKNYTEQIILGKIAIVLLQSAGAEVHDLTNIPGSTSVRQAELEGDVDFSFDYTGTAWVTYLGKTDPIPDEQRQYEAVRDADAENGLVWLPPAKMNNTYTLAVKSSVAEKYDLSTLEDISKLPDKERTYCVEAEFNARSYGFEPMLAAYDLPSPDSDARFIVDTGAIYAATADGTCTLGEVFTTDGRIPALDLVPLSDPRQFFPKYNMAPVVNDELLEQYPQLRQLLKPIIDDLDNERMQNLNRQVDVDGKDYSDVAFDYLQDLGIVKR
ncbi:MAG: glycine betaine ABC transporter substrate-binding protein [Brevibacterium sp.]|nr:glycine betaine ABC transporter substrate-binding protein [Brevibacterium sp.]